MKTETKLPEIRRGRTEIDVPFNHEKLTFVYPFAGPNTYTEVGSELLRSFLSVPIGDYTAALLHPVYCGEKDFRDSPESERVREIMRNRRLWVFNRNLWTAQGVYVLPDIFSKGIQDEPLNVDLLEARLQGGNEVKGIRFSQEGDIRFAPKETYRLGEHTSTSLAEDGFVIAGYNVRGAEQLGEISSRFKYNPRVYGVDVQDKDKQEQTVSALDSGWGLDGRLGVDGDDLGGGRLGCAFGVQIAPKARAEK